MKNLTEKDLVELGFEKVTGINPPENRRELWGWRCPDLMLFVYDSRFKVIVGELEFRCPGSSFPVRSREHLAAILRVIEWGHSGKEPL